MIKVICISKPKHHSEIINIGKIYNTEIIKINEKNIYYWRVYIDMDDLRDLPLEKIYTDFIHSNIDAGEFMELNEYRNSQIQKLGIV